MVSGPAIPSEHCDLGGAKCLGAILKGPESLDSLPCQFFLLCLSINSSWVSQRILSMGCDMYHQVYSDCFLVF